MRISIVRLLLSLIFLVVPAVVSYSQSAGSPVIYEVKFEKGVFVKKGTVAAPSRCLSTGPTECGNGNYTNLSIKAKKGDRIRITLASDYNAAVFTVSTSQRQPISGATAATSWSGGLPSDDNFLITVYTFKRFAGYTLKIVKLK